MGRGSVGRRVKLAYLLQPPNYVQWSAFYKQCIPVQLSLASTASEISAKLSRTELGVWSLGASAVPKTPFGEWGGGEGTKALSQLEKENWKTELLHIWLKTFLDQLKKKKHPQNNKNPTLLVILTPSLNRNNPSPLSLCCEEAFTFPGITLSAGISDPILWCWTRLFNTSQ